MEGPLVAVAIRDFMADKTEWQGTMSDLYKVVASIPSEQKGKDFPLDPNALGKRFDRDRTTLAKIGIRGSSKRTHGQKTWTLTKVNNYGSGA